MQYSSANLTLPHTITDHKNAMNIRYKPPYPQTFQFLFEISVLVICTYFCYLMIVILLDFLLAIVISDD